MKKTIVAIFAVVPLLSALGFKAIKYYADVLKTLQIETADAKESIFINFQDGVLDFPYAPLVTKFAVGKRPAAVKELGDLIKTYTESPEFEERYKAAREEAKPQGIQSDADKIQARLEQLEKDREETMHDMEKATGDKKNLLYHTLEQITKETTALSIQSDPNHDYYVKKLTKVKGWEKDMASEDFKEWQKNYPLTVKELVKHRLAEFLELTGDIDFNAKLIKDGSKMVFADPVLEAKSTEWKRCFRCGKETITVARAYAQQWLATLK